MLARKHKVPGGPGGQKGSQLSGRMSYRMLVSQRAACSTNPASSACCVCSIT